MSEQVVNKKTFEVEVEGKKLKFAVLRPNHRVLQDGTLVYNRAFRVAVTPNDGKPGALLRQKVDQVLRDQQLWDDEMQERYDNVLRTLLTGEKKLAQGGIKLSEAKAISLDMRRARVELRILNIKRNELDGMTAESQAEQARFNFYVSACTVYADSGKRYFADEEDYLTRDDDPVARAAESHLARLLYGLEDDFEAKLPENKFLLQYNFVDAKLRLVNRQGKWVDEFNRLVDEQGRLVNEKGELIDADGNLLTEDGEYKVEFKPFEDDVSEPAPEAPVPAVVEQEVAPVAA